MNVPERFAGEHSDGLPQLIDRAANALMGARTHAEVLEAKLLAGVAYDAAKKVARIVKAKEAHDSLLAEVYRAQADALAIEAGAKRRLADEYDAAQERGEVAKRGWESGVDKSNTTTASDLGLRRDEIHEARQIRDAEAADPGITQRTLDRILSEGREPTKADLRREIIKKPAQKQMDPKALWLWGRLKDFERDGIITSEPSELFSEMTPPMQADVRRLAPIVARFLQNMEQKNE